MQVNKTPTPAQLKWLRRSNRLGVIECLWTRGLARSSYERCMRNMVAAGWVTPYVHGGYEVTVEGQRVSAAT